MKESLGASITKEMLMEFLKEKVYLGDAVYARFDGVHIVLTTEDFGEHANIIYLDENVLKNIDIFRTKIKCTIDEINKIDIAQSRLVEKEQ